MSGLKVGGFYKTEKGDYYQLRWEKKPYYTFFNCSTNESETYESPFIDNSGYLVLTKRDIPVKVGHFYCTKDDVPYRLLFLAGRRCTFLNMVTKQNEIYEDSYIEGNNLVLVNRIS